VLAIARVERKSAIRNGLATRAQTAITASPTIEESFFLTGPRGFGTVGQEPRFRTELGEQVSRDDAAMIAKDYLAAEGGKTRPKRQAGFQRSATATELLLPFRGWSHRKWHCICLMPLKLNVWRNELLPVCVNFDGIHEYFERKFHTACPESSNKI
jgi:hypothetical protein